MTVCNDTGVVSPADSRFLDCWNIDENARLTAKGQTYYLSELLADSLFKDCFAGDGEVVGPRKTSSCTMMP